MSTISTDAAPVSGSLEKSWLLPYRIALVVTWVVTIAATIVMLFDNTRSTGQHQEIRYLLQVGYAAALLCYLGWSGLSFNQLPGIRPHVLPCWKFGAWIIVRSIRLVQRRWWFARLRRHLGHQVEVTVLASLDFGDAEETWLRLFLMGLHYFLLRPAFRSSPAVAGVATVLFSGITFGMGHGFTPERFLVTGLLYGVPMAANFARRDWEHAVGAHYMVNMIPWLMVFLET